MRDRELIESLWWHSTAVSEEVFQANAPLYAEAADRLEAQAAEIEKLRALAEAVEDECEQPHLRAMARQALQQGQNNE